MERSGQPRRRTLDDLIDNSLGRLGAYVVDDNLCSELSIVERVSERAVLTRQLGIPVRTGTGEGLTPDRCQRRHQ